MSCCTSQRARREQKPPGDGIVFLLALLAGLLGAASAQLGGGNFGTEIVRVGGSLGLTGEFSVPSTSLLRGITLLAETVNNSGAFRDPFGSTLAVRLHIEDDHGQAERVDQIYSRLAAQSEVDFFFGPYSSKLTMVAAGIANATRTLAVLAGGASPTIYQQGFRYIFSMSAKAEDYMENGLEILWSMGARTLVAAFDHHEHFSRAVCQGAIAHAERIGFQFLTSVTVGAQELTSHVRRLMAFSPDVFVVCGHFQDSVLTIMASRALGFNPKAILINSGASQAFKRAVGSSNANYIMAPVSWAPPPSRKQDKLYRVFGSAEGFAEAYRKRWGEEPTEQSAQAAAAGIALLAGVEAAGTLKVEEVNDAMLNLDIKSFFGPLAFFKNGTRRNATSMTQQWQPPGHDARRFQSEIAAVDEDHPPLWPMPSWEQKELQVYPCKPGEVWELRPQGRSLQGGVFGGAQGDLPQSTMDCLPCPVGRYRHLYALHCELCSAGTYGDQEGMEKCKPCPKGARCPPGARYGLPNATAGYYVLPGGALSVEPCNPQELCLGANKCKGANQGLLCEQCKEGYSNKGLLSPGKKCRECPGFLWNLLIVCLMFLLLLYFGTLVRKAISSSANIQEIQSGIAKICVSYLQFAGIAFEATEFVDMLEDIFQERSFWFWPLTTLAKLSVNPLEVIVSFQCLAPGKDIREDHVSIVLGFLLIPVAISVNILILWLKRRFKIYLWYRRYRSLKYEAQQAIARQYAAQKAVMSDPDGSYSMSIGESTASTETSEAVNGSGEATNATPPHPDVMDITASNEAIAARRAWRDLEHKGKHSWMQSSIVWCFVLHAITVRLLLTPFQCVDLDVLRLKSNLHIACSSEEHLTWISWSSAGLLIFGLGTPLVLFKMLHNVRDRLYHADVRRSVGFLYNGFEMHLYFFEPIYMFRKVAILLISVVPTRFVRLIGMALLSSSFLFIHSTYQPYDNRGFFCLDVLEFVSLRALLITAAGRLIFDVCRELSPQDGSLVGNIVEHPLTDIFIVCMVVACHLWFIIYTLWSIFRNTVLKHIKLKADIWPERTPWLERMMLDVAFCRLNKVTMDEKTLFLDTSRLAQRERFFLFTGLSNTLERYVDVAEKVQPALVTSAVHHAFHRAKHSREARLTNLIHLRARSKGKFMSQMHGELHMALQGTTGKTKMDLETIVSDQSMSDLVELEVLQLQKIQKEGIYVEELYNHLMLVWPDILQHRPRFFELPIYAPDDGELSLQSVTPMMLARNIGDDEEKESARTRAVAFARGKSSSRFECPAEELEEDTIHDLFGPQIDLHGRAKDPETLLTENRQLVKESVELSDQHAELERQHSEIKAAVQSRVAALELAASFINLGTEDAEYAALEREHLAVKKAVRDAEAALELADSVAKADASPASQQVPVTLHATGQPGLQFTGCMLQPASPEKWRETFVASI